MNNYARKLYALYVHARRTYHLLELLAELCCTMLCWLASAGSGFSKQQALGRISLQGVELGWQPLSTLTLLRLPRSHHTCEQLIAQLVHSTTTAPFSRRRRRIQLMLSCHSMCHVWTDC